jgi:hypothetical protein
MLNDLDTPELLWYEIFDPEVPVYDKAQRRKLARSYLKIRNTIYKTTFGITFKP